MTTETDRQTVNRQPFFLIPCLGFSISLYLSLFLRLVAICVMRKRKFSEYEMAFIPFQTLGACSLPRSPSSPILPTPSLACLLFITFILISLKLSHKLKFVLSLFSPPLLCLAHKWQTKIFYVHPKLSKYCSPPAILVLLCLSFFSPLLASRFFSAISFLPLFCCWCCCRCCCGVCCRSAFASTPTLQAIAPSSQPARLAHNPPTPLLCRRRRRRRRRLLSFFVCCCYICSLKRKNVSLSVLLLLLLGLYIQYIFASSVFAHFRCSLALPKL